MNNKIEYVERLESILKTCKKDKGYDGKSLGVRITFADLQASKSGMSRKFKMYVINRKGEMLNITYLVSKILGETFTNDDRIRVYGCGMDMLFNTCYELNCAIYRAKGHKKYNHDKAYHGYVNTSYNLL
ncbi:MAG: hypothetical protein K6E74_03740 [Bacilli bacterium]|nr:hypothetical protein [Bacilli bacterium]